MLSASRQGPSLCENDKERKSTTAEAKDDGGAKNLPCLLSDSEAEGMRLKALGLLPKKPFYFQKKKKNQRAGNQLRDKGVGGRSFTVIHF